MDKILTVDFDHTRYDIHSGAKSYGSLKRTLSGKTYLVADETAYVLHQDKLDMPFAGISFVRGEKDKSLVKAGDILQDMARAGISRSDSLVAFGGGVCGDLAGFCASIYMRGIPYHQVPTTLLAQVDSSVGGKCGVNLPEGKNLVGSFHHPAGVFLRRDVLLTLPPEQVRCGVAEMLKTAMLFDEGMVEDFELRISGIPSGDMILRCVDEKRKIVQKDPRDRGERMLLNFGHTLGHAVESFLGYGSITHGEAVAVGMMETTRISERRGWTREGLSERMERLLVRHGLPVSLDIDMGDLARFMERDKKILDRKLRLVILREMGQPDIMETDTGFFTEGNTWK
ncbi:MAG: 3-dehydroquinate synthase [Clostridia bacterium]